MSLLFMIGIVKEIHLNCFIFQQPLIPYCRSHSFSLISSISYFNCGKIKGSSNHFSTNWPSLTKHATLPQICIFVQLVITWRMYEGVSRSFRTGRLGRELQMVQISATRCSYIAILWASLVSFPAITLHVASQWRFIVVYFVIDSVRKLMHTPSYEF
jgi:hypothetical protein